MSQRKTMLYTLIMLFVTVIFYGCTPEEINNVQITAVPTGIQSATLLPTLPPISTAQPTPTSTNTPIVTLTSTATPTRAPTLKVVERFNSPDGEWSAVLESKDSHSGDYPSYIFLVISNDGKHKWIVESFDYDKYSLIGHDRRIPIHWSENSMYFIHDRVGDGCSSGTYGYDLYRLNLRNGETIELVPEGHSFSISPNEEKVAYLINNELALHDLTTNEETITSIIYDSAIEHINFSDLTWAPDGSSLLVFGAEDVCVTGIFDAGRNLIIRMDTQSYIQETIIHDTSLRKIVDWTEMDKVEVYVDGGEIIWLNPETGKITPVVE